MIVDLYKGPARWATNNPLAAAILIALGSRVAVFVYAIFVPFTNEVGMPVSPASLQPWIEFEFYQQSLELYRTLSSRELLDMFVQFYARPISEYGVPVRAADLEFGGHNSSHLIGGPVFPALIGFFDYRDGNTLPLATVFLVLSVGVSVIWLRWLSNRNIPAIWLWVFALLPNPFWFMLNVTTDLVFAFLVVLFYLSYFRERWRRWDIVAWVVLMILCVLTRPNGAAILLFVFLDFLWRGNLMPFTRVVAIVALSLTGLAAAGYLFPYFAVEMSKVTAFRFFGTEESQFLSGLYLDFPPWLDLPLSWLSLLLAKTMYLVGLRPSDAGVGFGWVFVRAIAGVILLPGLIYVSFRAPRRDRLFVWIFLLPIFLGPTQERYNLAIQPLLYFYGVQVFVTTWVRLRGRGDEPNGTAWARTGTNRSSVDRS